MNCSEQRCGGTMLEAFCLNRAGPPLLVAARPGAEILGAGGQLSRWNPSALLSISRGPGPARELQARALALADIGPERLQALDFAHHDTTPHLTGITLQVARFFRLYAPGIVVTHAYEGADADQDAAAFAVSGACRILGENAPLHLEMSGLHHWEGRVRTGHFLPAEESTAFCTLRLSWAQRALKSAMLAHFPMVPVAAPVDDAISRELDPFVERFRVAPRYDFTRPPHAGPLLYEVAGAPGSSLQWRARAAEALAALFAEIPAPEPR